MPIFGDFDIAQLVLYAFWAFFFALVVYLQRETMREGYPLESEFTGKPEMSGLFGDLPEPKTFKLPFGRGEVSYPNPEKDALEITDRPFAMKATAPWSGAPFEPTGNPLIDGIGPAAWAERRDEIELTLEGHAKIVPLRADAAWSIPEGDSDIRGRTVMGCDGKAAGTLKDLWMDRSEQLFRYIEVEVPSGRSVLVPMTGVMVSNDLKTVWVDSIRADQFADIPGLKNPEQITKLEEEKVMAYVAGGKLYASRDRVEPLL
jgi:photosynthetic reaction center H subunit